MSSVSFLDIAFDPMSFQDALKAIANRASELRAFAYVATPNVDHVLSHQADPVARAPLYEGAWLTLNDSRILELLARWSGLRLPAAPGSDLAAALALRHIRPDEPVTVIGGDAELIAALKARFGWTDVRWHAPPMGLARNPTAIAAAAAFAAAQRTRFTFLCVGAPQQELVAAAIAARGDAVGVGLCVGAALEFLAGRKQRAPRWLRRARLEWLHRLASEPARMAHRYLIKGPGILAAWLSWRSAAAARALTLPAPPQPAAR